MSRVLSEVKSKNRALIAIIALAFVCALFGALFANVDVDSAFAAEETPDYYFSVDYSQISTEYSGEAQPFPLNGVTLNGVPVDESRYKVAYTSATVPEYVEENEAPPSEIGNYTVRFIVTDADGAEIYSEIFNNGIENLTYDIKQKRLSVQVTGPATNDYYGGSFARDVYPKQADILPGEDVNIIVTYTGTAEAHRLAPGARPKAADTYTMSFAVDNPKYIIGDIEDDYLEAPLTLTINKLKLDAQVLDASVTYGRTPEFKITLIGFINNENASVITEMPSVRNAPTTVGTHEICPSGGSAENYDFNYVKGKLTVNKLNAEGTIANSATFITCTGIFSPETSFNGEEIDVKSEDGKDCLATVRKFRLTDFTSSPKLIYKITAEEGGVRSDSVPEGTEGRINYATITFHNCNLDSSNSYFIVFLGAKGGVTKITKYEYANGTLTFKAPDVAGTVVVYRNAQTLIITSIVVASVVIFLALLYIASKIKYYNEKKEIDESIRRKKKARNKYRW